jgi:stringent starvation protein B
MNKKQILLDHLAIAKTTIALDPTCEGVKLPKDLMSKDTVRLNLSNTFSGPMQFRDDKVIATLSFSGVSFECHIPYKAIFAVMIAGNLEDAIVFDESIPQTTKRLIPLLESNNVDAFRFMADLQLQFERDDITVGQYNDKPQ